MSAEKIGDINTDFSEPDPDNHQEATTRFDAIVAHNYGPLRRIAQIGSRLLGRRTDSHQEKPYGEVTKETEEMLLKPFAIDAPRASETSSPEPTPKPIS